MKYAMPIAIGSIGIGMVAVAAAMFFRPMVPAESSTYRRSSVSATTAPAPESPRWDGARRFEGRSMQAGDLAFRVTGVKFGKDVTPRVRDRALSVGKDEVVFTIEITNSGTSGAFYSKSMFRLLDSEHFTTEPNEFTYIGEVPVGGRVRDEIGFPASGTPQRLDYINNFHGFSGSISL